MTTPTATLRGMLDGSVCAYCGLHEDDARHAPCSTYDTNINGIPLALHELLTAMVAQDTAGGEAGR